MFGGQRLEKAQHRAANTTAHMGWTDEDCVDLPVLDCKHACANNQFFIDGNVEVTCDDAHPFIGEHTIDPSGQSGLRIMLSACSMH
ncbi:hypothetical protein NCPPB3923_06720 [Burkholderia glumae]|nr:hypothetical protein NCPPB3923_06720 [Burkholderia glumae]